MEENLFLFRRFRLLDQAGKQRVDQQFQEMELTAMQSYVLRYLHDRSGEVVYPKEAKGFIVCTPDPDDRRCKRVTATEKAEQCHLRIRDTFHALEQETLQNFSPEEVQTLLRLLDRAIENLSEGKEEA